VVPILAGTDEIAERLVSVFEEHLATDDWQTRPRHGHGGSGAIAPPAPIAVW